jgi:hypothetical protein
VSDKKTRCTIEAPPNNHYGAIPEGLELSPREIVQAQGGIAMPIQKGKGKGKGKGARAPGVHKIGGRAVEIREHQGREALWIDGERQAFFVTADGYTLHADAYARPAPSLLEAVEQYLRRRPAPHHDH